MTDYLPKDANSTIALNVMDEEFGEAVPNCNVMVENVSIMEALNMKAKLEELEGVSKVSWLDDAVDLMQPLEMQNQDLTDDYYTNENLMDEPGLNFHAAAQKDLIHLMQDISL